MRLVAHPVEKGTAVIPLDTVTLVREVYTRIYRIEDVEGNDSFGQVVASLTPDGL